jgi:hypothetical protein
MKNGVWGAVKDAAMEITKHRMPGVGHAFPESEKALVKEWIQKTVVPGLTSPARK